MDGTGLENMSNQIPRTQDHGYRTNGMFLGKGRKCDEVALISRHGPNPESFNYGDGSRWDEMSCKISNYLLLCSYGGLVTSYSITLQSAGYMYS